jgi:protein-tyrosine-phosphatase
MRFETAALILFVCTGNQIRSPLTAAIFQRRLSESGLQNNYRVESAGTWALDGQFDVLVRATALRMGLDIEKHCSRSIDREMLIDARLIIVMERGQKEALEVEFPQVCGKVKLLSQLAGESPYDVLDPAGKELGAYLHTGVELLRLVNLAFEPICRIVQEQ